MTNKEGVIKFFCHWTNARFESPVDLSQIIKVRNEVRQLSYIGADKEGVGYGNVSVLCGLKEFVISGTQTGALSILSPDEFSIVTDYDIQHNSLSCTGVVKASSESLTHAALYDCSDEIKSVLHFHSMELWQKYQGILPTTSLEAEYGTVQMAEAVAEVGLSCIQSNQKIIVLGGHPEGLIAFGDSPEDAFQAIIKLSKI